MDHAFALAGAREALAARIKTLMGKPNGRKVITSAIEMQGNGEVNIRAITCSTKAWWDPYSHEVNIDPNYRGTYMTSGGMLQVPNYITLGHELGHAAGADDDGPGNLNNIRQWENPIRRDFGISIRTVY